MTKYRYINFKFHEKGAGFRIEVKDTLDESTVIKEVSSYQLLKFIEEQTDCNFIKCRNWYMNASDEQVQELLKDYFLINTK